MNCTTITILTALALTAPVASAGFVNEVQQNTLMTAPQLRVIGTGSFDKAVGMGRDVPLREALNTIVPPSFAISSVGVDAFVAKKVSWAGGSGWDSVLSSVLESTPEVCGEINTEVRTVVLKPCKADDAAEIALKEGVVGEPGQKKSSWVIHPSDGGLRTTFERWAQQAGWQLVWDLKVDYPINASASLESTFEQAVQAVTKSLQQSQVAPKATFYRGNRVLRISVRGTE